MLRACPAVPTRLPYVTDAYDLHRDAERDLDDKNFLAVSLADLRKTLESRVRCGLVKHHIHILHDSPGDQVAAVEVRWVERVLVRHPFRRGNNALPPSSSSS